MVPFLLPLGKSDARVTRRAVFPGSFDPLTVAHLAIAEAVLARPDVGMLDLVLSRVALAKEDARGPAAEHRARVVAEAARTRPGLGVVVTEAQLVVEIAGDYDLVVVGADKWAQLHDVAFYESPAHRDEALRRLPEVVVVPRPPHPVPPGRELELPDHLADVSSTAVRSGRRDWMAPEALRFDEATGAWSDPERYERWRTTS